MSCTGKILNDSSALESRIGKTESVLIEEEDEQGRGMGYTGGYMRVHVKQAVIGEVMQVLITGIENNELTGELQ